MWKNFVEFTSAWTDEAIVIRLILAVIIGVALGTGRTLKRRSAGIKTHSLVCLGATVVMLTGQYIYFNFPGQMDITRLGAQVISGVGFLGVGTILVTGRNQIRGLTTAAGLWVCACFGLALGAGFVDVAIYASLLALLSLKVLTRIESMFLQHGKYFDLYLEFDRTRDVAEFMKIIRQGNVRVENLEINKNPDKGVNALLSIEVNDKEKRYNFVENVREMEMVTFAEEL